MHIILLKSLATRMLKYVDTYSFVSSANIQWCLPFLLLEELAQIFWPAYLTAGWHIWAGSVVLLSWSQVDQFSPNTIDGHKQFLL